MTLADVLVVISGLAIAGSGFACLSTILSMWVPETLERAGARATGRPGRSLVLGFLFFLVTVVLVGGLLKAGGPAPVFALGLVVLDLSFAILGAAGAASRLGRRSRGDAGGSPGLGDLLRGVFLLEGAALLPIVGWFAVLPFGFLIALGAGLHAVVRRGSSPQTVPAAATQS